MLNKSPHSRNDTWSAADISFVNSVVFLKPAKRIRYRILFWFSLTILMALITGGACCWRGATLRNNSGTRSRFLLSSVEEKQHMRTCKLWFADTRCSIEISLSIIGAENSFAVPIVSRLITYSLLFYASGRLSGAWCTYFLDFDVTCFFIYCFNIWYCWFL